MSTPGANSVIDAEGWKRRAAKVPLSRLITPEEVAGTTALLCSPDALRISSVTIRIDDDMTVAGP